MSTHPRKGEDTYFVEKVLTSLGIDYLKNEYYYLLLELNQKIPTNVLLDFYNSLVGNQLPKPHTIRGGNHFKANDKISLRVWSGKPYNSKQIIIAPDIEVKKIWELIVDEYGIVEMPKAKATTILQDIAKNDGLSIEDFIAWFKDFKQAGTYQIICWNENIEY